MIKEITERKQKKTTREPPLNRLTETFGDLTCDPKFMAWLASKLDLFIR